MKQKDILTALKTFHTAVENRVREYSQDLENVSSDDPEEQDDFERDGEYYDAQIAYEGAWAIKEIMDQHLTPLIATLEAQRENKTDRGR
jgi:hypothetical protein